MSIEKIKSYIDILETGGRVEVIDVLKSILDILIEQHEEKETENDKTHNLIEQLRSANDYVSKIKLLQKEKDIALSELNTDPVVEVGQIWRHKQDGDLCEVVGFNGNSEPYITYGRDCAGNVIEFPLLYELVTMENIKENEWAKRLPSGEKLKITAIDRKPEGDMLVFSDGYTYVYRDSGLFKPCLPPVEEQPKLYTQEELDNAVKIAQSQIISMFKLMFLHTSTQLNVERINNEIYNLGYVRACDDIKSGIDDINKIFSGTD